MLSVKFALVIAITLWPLDWRLTNYEWLGLEIALVIAIALWPLAWRLTNYEWIGLESKENITYEKFTYDQSSLSTLIWVSA